MVYSFTVYCILFTESPVTDVTIRPHGRRPGGSGEMLLEWNLSQAAFG